MKNYQEYSSDDFIQDASFIEWVQRPTPDLDLFWNKVIKLYPERMPELKIAFSIIKSISTSSEEITQQEIDELWSMINKSITSKRNGLFYFIRYAAAAAIFIFLFTGGWWIHRSLTFSQFEINYSQIEAPAEIKSEVSLFLVDNTELKIQDEESTIIYNHDGNLTINESEQVSQPVGKTAGSKVLLNQIVVPYGKRTSIVFSDGTKLWVNSGSRAIYPVEFDAKRREIYVEGEVYFEVTEDKNKPFIVKTNKMEIEVLGTSFNVSSYPDETNVSVVLASGNIKIKPENKKVIKVYPNQLLVYSKETKEVYINEVNTYDYISWKDGFLNCNNEEISLIINKLSRYYNQQFVFEDHSIKALHFSGKLDLKDNFDEVLRVLSLAASLEFGRKNEVIYIRDLMQL